MSEEPTPPPSRPGLGEFLGALNGFLVRQAPASKEAGLSQFLDVFCRSIGAAGAQLLEISSDGAWLCRASCGLPAGFDHDFAEGQRGASWRLLSDCLKGPRVGAVSDFTDEPGVPGWFAELANRHGLRALAAVPVIDASAVTGLICAYYRDVCLFDQDTLDRLLAMGRMVGTGAARGPAEIPPSPAAEAVDAFLASIAVAPPKKAEVMDRVAQTIREGFQPDGFLFGAISETAGGFFLMDGARAYRMPATIEAKIRTGRWPETATFLLQKDWGDLVHLVKKSSFRPLCQPMVWAGRAEAAAVVWRSQNDGYRDEDDRALRRLMLAAALMQHVL